MTRNSIVQYLNPWRAAREERQRRLDELRKRDGDNCRRCRRPLRFDLPSGHDRAPTIQPISREANGGAGALDNLCLCHARCNAQTVDATPEVQERMLLSRRAQASDCEANGSQRVETAKLGRRVA